MHKFKGPTFKESTCEEVLEKKPQTEKLGGQVTNQVTGNFRDVVSEVLKRKQNEPSVSDIQLLEEYPKMGMGIKTLGSLFTDENFQRQRETESKRAQETYDGYSEKEKSGVEIMRLLLELKHETKKAGATKLPTWLMKKLFYTETNLVFRFL